LPPPTVGPREDQSLSPAGSLNSTFSAITGKVVNSAGPKADQADVPAKKRVRYAIMLDVPTCCNFYRCNF
jgi:hypothetical protein